MHQIIQMHHQLKAEEELGKRGRFVISHNNNHSNIKTTTNIYFNSQPPSTTPSPAISPTAGPTFYDQPDRGLFIRLTSHIFGGQNGPK